MKGNGLEKICHVQTFTLVICPWVKVIIQLRDYILSRSNLAMKSLFWYVCTVVITSEIWPWVKVMTHPWVMANNCVKLYPDRTRGYEVMARTRCEQTDRRTDKQGDTYIPPNFVCGGYKYSNIKKAKLQHDCPYDTDKYFCLWASIHRTFQNMNRPTTKSQSSYIRITR